MESWQQRAGFVPSLLSLLGATGSWETPPSAVGAIEEGPSARPPSGLPEPSARTRAQKKRPVLSRSVLSCFALHFILRNSLALNSTPPLTPARPGILFLLGANLQ